MTTLISLGLDLAVDNGFKPMLDVETIVTCCAIYSVAMILTFYYWDWKEYMTTRWYFVVAIITSAAQILVWYYPHLAGETLQPGHNWSSFAHYQAEMVGWGFCTFVMVGLCLVDCFIYMPIDMIRLPKGADIPAYHYQVYYHHFLGLMGMIALVYEIGKMGGFDLTNEAEFNKLNQGMLTGNALEVQQMISKIKWCNSFVYLTEFSTIFLQYRSLVRLHAQETGIKTNPTFRNAVGLIFAASFYLCRVIPMIPSCLYYANNPGWPAVLDWKIALKGLTDQVGLSKFLFSREFLYFLEKGGDFSRLWLCNVGFQYGFISCFGFAALNIFWASEIWRSVGKALCPKRAPKSAEKVEKKVQ